MTIDEIRELISLVTETGVAELEVQRGENRVRIRRGNNSEPVDLPPPQAAAAAPPPKPVESASAPSTPETAESLVKSPIVGTYYESASPGSPPFVRIGETVQPGKVLCIIESMKLMNEIEAEESGVVTKKLVANGQPVEYGEALFAIRPL
ncbi:MAG: acetyl-CoA carboxylase biotin carboxyl carrier protein [Bryobacteraceae bacterium]